MDSTNNLGMSFIRVETVCPLLNTNTYCYWSKLFYQWHSSLSNAMTDIPANQPNKTQAPLARKVIFPRPSCQESYDNYPRELAPGMPGRHHRLFVSKIHKRGAITELCTHRNIRGLDVTGRSGHATGTSLDSYLDKTYIVRGLRGGKALSNFKDIDADVKVPRLECLGAHTVAAVQALISKLFVVSVPAFLPEGSLHMVLRTCTASLIMYHRRVTADFGYVDAVVTKLRNSARSATITDTRFPNKSPESILDDWSIIIMKDYEDRNPEMAQATPDMVQLAAVLNQQSQLLMQLTAGMSDIKAELVSEQRKNSDLDDNVAFLTEELARANRKLAVFKTPPPAVASSSASRTRTHAEVDQPGGDGGGGGGSKSRRLEHPAEGLRGAQSSGAPEQARVPSGTARSAARVPRQELCYGAEARGQEASTDRNKYVSIVLQDLYRTGHLKAPVWKDIAFPKHYNERSLLKNTLELVEMVITDEERRLLPTTCQMKISRGMVRASRRSAWTRCWCTNVETQQLRRRSAPRRRGRISP
jgi:hypothetical protein